MNFRGWDYTKMAMILLAVFLSYRFLYFHPLTHPPGILIPNEPVQTPVTKGTRGFKYKNHFIEPLAQYKISVRILSIENYWLDAGADVAPVDWAVGWQQMSDSQVIDLLKINQGNRFYFYSWRSHSPLLDPEVMKRTSANMHLIPADAYVKKMMDKARIGHLVDLKGYLVRVNKRDGSEMRSSLSREDTGAGACEVMWVTDIQYRN